jgi:integrase
MRQRISKFKIGRLVKNGLMYYTLFVPSYLSADRKERRLYFRTRQEAEKHRTELIAATRSESRETVLSNSQMVDARRALERLAEHGLSMTLDKAIELAIPTLKSTGRYVAVSSLLDAFAKVKAASWRPHTARNFKVVARMFAERYGERSVADITPKLLEEWFADLEKKPAYIAGLIRTLRPAFSYALRQGMIPDCPFSKLEPVRVPARERIDIFTPEEARKLMETAPADCKTAYALLLFAGIRPTELTKMTWANVRDGFIHITPGIAKVGQVRNVEIEPTLQAWLDAAGRHQPSDSICPSNWKRKNQETRRLAGLANRQDVPRHSYATYHLAKYRDRGLLESNMGHSHNSAMLMKHYRAAATPAQAEAYWAILPE